MGVIAPSAIRKFERRLRSDFRPWKQMRSDELLEIARRLPVMPPIWRKLRLHQKVCTLIGAYRRHFGFHLDTGMGKTLLTLALYCYYDELGYHRNKPAARWLILVPNKSNKKAWADEVQKHTPFLKIIRLIGSTEQKWQTLLDNPDADLIVETYGGLMHLLSTWVEDERKSAKKINKARKIAAKKAGRQAKVKERLKWNAARIDQLCGMISGMVLDESIKVMNKSALPHRICAQIRKRLDKGNVYELNGTPFGRDPEAVWGQVYLLDRGHSLGETLGIFRQCFFNRSKGRFGEPVYKFDKKKGRMLHDFLADRTIEYEADEGDLPRVVPIVKKIYLPGDAEAYAERAKREIIAAKGNYVESKNAFMRMRQISSGWLGYKDDDSGDKAQINFKPNHKLEFLLDYVASINPKYKFIVFHEFNYSGELICKGLKEEKIGHAWVYGKTKDPDAELERFNSDPNCRALVLSNSAGSYGLNLQIAKYGIYFEAPVSPIIRYQTRKRFERQYSPHRSVFRVDLVVAGTYDESILAFHEEGKDLFDAIIRGRFKGPKKELSATLGDD